jgi:hypothetical protein
VLSHAAWVCLCQIASQQLKRPSYTPFLKSSRLELFVCAISCLQATCCALGQAEKLSSSTADVVVTVGACMLQQILADI